MWVELIDYMGDDLTVVNSARVSFNKQSDWEEIDTRSLDAFGEMIISKGLSEKDQKLIQYLAKHGHWTPFSHVQIQMRETVPIFVARQRFKHMVGFTYNEVSRRYVDDPPQFYVPGVWRGAPTDGAKQGSSDQIVGEVKSTWFNVLGEDVYYTEYLEACSLMYKAMIDRGVAPEQARIVLPTATYTSYYVTGSLAAWARAYKLRSAPDAQKEIQELARQWNEIISSIPEMKYSWAALTS